MLTCIIIRLFSLFLCSDNHLKITFSSLENGFDLQKILGELWRSVTFKVHVHVILLFELP